jgi:hypothetical protein
VGEARRARDDGTLEANSGKSHELTKLNILYCCVTSYLCSPNYIRLVYFIYESPFLRTSFTQPFTVSLAESKLPLT